MTRKNERVPAAIPDMDLRRRMVIGELLRTRKQVGIPQQLRVLEALAENVLYGAILEKVGKVNQQNKDELENKLGNVRRRKSGLLARILPQIEKQREEEKLTHHIRMVNEDLETARKLAEEGGKRGRMIENLAETLIRTHRRTGTLIEANRLGGPVRASKGLKEHFGGK